MSEEEQQQTRKPRSYKGIGQLCFLPNDNNPSVFYGHFIDPISRVSLFGLSGKETDREVILDCCCQADDPPIFHKVVLVSYSEKKEVTLAAEKKGGDYVLLNGKHLEFVTKTIKVNDEAKEHTRRFLNPQLSYIEGIIVCIGDMTITDIDFDNPPVDSDFVCSHHSTTTTTTTNQNTTTTTLKTVTDHEIHKHHTHTPSHTTTRSTPDKNDWSHKRKKERDIDKRGEKDVDDDFGFEEDENVIKIGEVKEEVLWTTPKRITKRKMDSDSESEEESDE